VSHSTPESELVSADHAVRTFGTPTLDLWSLLLAKPDLHLTFHEDNATAIIAMQQGYSNTMRHLERTHGVCLRALAERFHEPFYHLVYERSALQSGDIYTKGFTNAAEWTRAVKLINHLDPHLFWEGQSGSSKSIMPSEHKGGVVYDYWTSNPWHQNGPQSLDDLKEDESTDTPAKQKPQARASMPVERLRSPEDPVEGSMPVKRLSLPRCEALKPGRYQEDDADYFDDETVYDSDEYACSEGEYSDED